MRRWMEAFIFCSKNLQNQLYRGTLQSPIFSERFSWLTCLVILSQVGLKSGVWRTASFYPPVFVDFSIALEAM